jgi:hypothetical protein
MDSLAQLAVGSGWRATDAGRDGYFRDFVGRWRHGRRDVSTSGRVGSAGLHVAGSRLFVGGLLDYLVVWNACAPSLGACDFTARWVERCYPEE